MEAEKIYEREENTEIENYEVDTESLVTDIVAEPEIVDDYKNCIFCNAKIDKDVVFCSFCGKPQNEEIKRPAENFGKKVYRKRKIKKVSNGLSIAVSIFSYISFCFSLFSFFAGIYRMLYMNVATISIFGSNSDALIVNQTYVIGNLLSSNIFLITGIFLFYLSRSVSSKINKK